jgi:hypothetical protein
MVGALTVRAAVWVDPFEVPVIVTFVSLPTATVVAVKVTLVAPAGTVAVASTVVEGSLDVKVTG